MEHIFLLSLAICSGFMMSWAIGANDVANAMGTSVGSKSITVKQAIVIAIIFEALGAMLASGQVTTTLRQDIVDISLFANTPLTLVVGMLGALFSSATWLIIATVLGWPVSTTHTIVGAIIGFGLVSVGFENISWGSTLDIALSWVVTPLVSAAVAYFLFRSVNRLILSHPRPIERAKLLLPFYVFIAISITILVTLLQGLRPLGFEFSAEEAVLFASMVAGVGALFTYRRIHTMPLNSHDNDPFHFVFVERAFGILTVFTACAMAFAHGSNDVANAIGPLAAIVDILQSGQMSMKSSIPLWVVGLGSLGVVSGLATYGYRIIETVGKKITPMTPSRSFSAQLSTATVVILSSGMGFPVSTTHTLVGAVLGVGLARGLGALNLNVVRSIFLSWVVTLPIGGILSVIYYVILKRIFL